MLVLTVPPDAAELGQRNCIVMDLPDGQRVRFWLCETSRRGVKIVIDAPPVVHVRRGPLVGADAAERGVCR